MRTLADFKRLLPTFSCVLIAVIFFVAAIDKTAHMARFERALEAQGIIPVFFLPTVAKAIVALEFIISLALLARPFRRVALLGALVLLVAFIVVLLVVSSSSSISDCGCGSLFANVPIPWKIGQDVIMVILAAWTLYMLKRSSQRMCPQGPPCLDTYSQ